MSISTVTTKTMLSTEIAALTSKKHSHVMRDIEVIIEQLKTCPNLDTSIQAMNYKDSYGRNQKCYQLDYESTLVVLTGYDVVARTKVIKRWQELEQQTIKPMQVLNDPAAMRGFLTYSEKVIALESKVAEQAPKIEALARLSESDGSLCFTDAAKTLNIQPKKLFQWLQENQWIYRRAGGSGYIAYQNRIQSRVLEHKVTTVQRKDGSDKITEQARVTPKGLTKLAAIFDSTGAK
ncbi:MAG: phage regulatory protein/antirepressor Ant [Methylococcales bacterium]|nr:phage regulatory protein/antirepressor Ant [Methylococcales bacterium]MDD5754974.1 phage regulatory protein/antirepressor Ant [Methylococcales bacterium]